MAFVTEQVDVEIVCRTRSDSRAVGYTEPNVFL